MKISDLIQALERIKANNGDLPVRIDTISHTFPPDLAVRERGDGKVLVLNS